MELKEYIKIFKNFKGTFFGVVLFFIFAGIVFQLYRPLSYKTSLTMNVTRSGHQETSDYRYDEFYRLQADERFADTVVRWMSSPSITRNIYIDAEFFAEANFKSKRLSSQVIEVGYSTADIKSAKALAGSIIKVINQEAEKLNEEQKSESWFKVLGSEPVIRENKIGLGLNVLVCFLIGIFFGVWTVFVRNYLS